MGTTTERAAVGLGGIESQLNELLLDSRKSLPHGPNGHPKAPPSKAASTRKMIRQGLCCPFRHLIEVMDADIDDNVPLSEVNASLYRLIARNEVRAVERRLAANRPVPVLLLRAAKEVNEYELAALRVANSPDSVEAMEAVIREAADVVPVLTDLTRTVSLRVVRATTRPSRRLALEHAR